MALIDELNRVKFISEDFATYRSEADQFFADNFPDTFNNLIATDLGNALMDQLAFAMQALAFMVNRRSSELFLDTAKLNKSIVKLARMLGYPIAPASPATCDLTITFPGAPYTFPVTISAPFQFQGPGDIVYEFRNTTNAVLLPGETTLTIPIREGQSLRRTFVSNGNTNQQFSINGIADNEFLYEEDLVVTVDGVEWTLVSLLKFESLNIFEVLFTDSPPKLRFGDGILGNVPQDGAEIVIEFASGKGLSGAIGSNQITAPVNPLVINGIEIDMTFTNTVADVGSDPEDIRHVKAFASSFFRTQNAAVIKSDYDTIAQLESGVANADAQIIRGILNDLTMQGFFADINIGRELIGNAVTGIDSASVSGFEFVGVSGIDLLGVSGIGDLFVDGVSGLDVGGSDGLGVSGTEFLGIDGSIITGLEFLGVSGISGLQVIGQAGLIVGGTASLGVSGESDLGVSGIGQVGITDLSSISGSAVSGDALIATGTSGLFDYLSQIFSDTCVANQVQVIVLGVDVNNRYISPSSTVLNNVQTKLQGLADAVVTVKAVDGTFRIVNTDIQIELGISKTAVQQE